MKKWFLILFFSLLVVVSFLAYRYYSFIFSPNVETALEEQVLFISKWTNLESLADSLHGNGIIKDKKSFIWVADKMKYQNPKPGKYLIEDKLNNKELITKLRAGSQKPVVLTFNNVRTIEELCEIFGSELEKSKEAFLKYFTDSLVLENLDLNRENILSLFIPNTYEIYWTVDPSSLLKRMKQEYSKFWNTERTQKLNDIQLTKSQAYTLASIVQKESNLASEKPVIAGVYLNRLKKGMLLQADPTVVFAVGDFEIRRVLNKHLLINSPYNTYKYPGLPPGPIGMPDINTIDAVLNATDHDYLYFCVKPGTGFEHAFARNLREHNRNAAEYRRWLNSNRIYN